MPDRDEQGRPYRRRLDSPPFPDLEVALFRRLQAFDVEARTAGASRETLGAISAARTSLGSSDLKQWLPMPRGN